MPEKAVLYSYWRSTCSWRVRIALNLAGIEVEQIPVHLVRDGGEQHTEEYRRINPLGQVPAFKTGDFVLTQSVAIMEYIQDLHPEAGLLPSDPVARAKVRMVTELICSGIQPIQNLAVMKKHSQEQEEKLAWSRHWITVGFRALEKVLEGLAGDCCIGNTVTMADCCLVPQVDSF